MTPLHIAACEGHKEAITCLIRHGANVNITNHDKRNPLHEALVAVQRYKDSLEIINMLIAAGCDVNAKDQRGVLPLTYAVIQKSPEAMRILLEAGARADQATFDFAMFGLDGGIDDLVRYRQQPTAHNLHTAARNGKLKALQTILTAGIGIDASNAQGQTALMAAAGAGQYEAVSLLLLSGADKSLVDKDGNDALRLAKKQLGREDENSKKKLARVIALLGDSNGQQAR